MAQIFMIDADFGLLGGGFKAERQLRNYLNYILI